MTLLRPILITLALPPIPVAIPVAIPVTPVAVSIAPVAPVAIARAIGIAPALAALMVVVIVSATIAPVAIALSVPSVGTIVFVVILATAPLTALLVLVVILVAPALIVMRGVRCHLTRCGRWWRWLWRWCRSRCLTAAAARRLGELRLQLELLEHQVLHHPAGKLVCLDIIASSFRRRNLTLGQLSFGRIFAAPLCLAAAVVVVQ